MHSGKTVHDANFVRPVNCKKMRGARRETRLTWCPEEVAVVFHTCLRVSAAPFVFLCTCEMILGALVLRACIFSIKRKMFGLPLEEIQRRRAAPQTSNSVAQPRGSHLFSPQSQTLKTPVTWSYGGKFIQGAREDMIAADLKISVTLPLKTILF